MRAFLTRAVILSSALLMAATASAQTQGLARVGPTSAANGFPTWYQDKTGITLEFCQPQNALELEGGWCLLLAADTTVPEVFPTQFADEHFYYAADANLVSGNLNALLVIGLEAAFAVGPPIPGDQIVFARIRIRFDAPAAGTYTVYHPYGVDVLTATAAGERIFFTEDIGIQCLPGQFDCALKGRIGPFLLASNSPGGPELPAIGGPVLGKSYIADPARSGPVTGSPVGQNYFRIVGPGGIDALTNDFALMGRLFSGTMPGAVTINKARYGRAAGSAVGKVDVFATAFSTAQPRLPGGQVTGEVTPVLAFYSAPCSADAAGVLGAPAGLTPIQMFSAGSRYYGNYVGSIPASVCVVDLTARDLNGQIAPVYKQANVTDQVTITEALYNPADGGKLRVAAVSSDLNVPPTLTATDIGSFLSGTSIEGIVGVPPLMALVTSTAGGRAELEVSTLEGQPSFPAAPLAGNDTFGVAEDSGPNSLNVLANDTFGGVVIDPATTGLLVEIVQQPLLGAASVAGGTITYTPNPNAHGSDLLTYTVSVDGGLTKSPAAFVAITITNLNDVPVAVPDTATGVGNLPISVNLLANDTDADGGADLVGVNIVGAPAGITYTIVGGTLTFSAPAGTYVFTYQARDAATALSNEATVTVTLSGGETLTIVRADYIVRSRRWRIEGTSSVLSQQTVFVQYANGAFLDGSSAVGTLIASAQVDPLTGAWAIDFTLAGANDPRNPTSGLFSIAPTSLIAITTLGGTSPVTGINLR